MNATGTRHEKMVDAAVWLAEQGFADIGWAPVSHGKAPHRGWKSDATDDPALIRKMLHGARNALVIPKGKAAVVDIDDPAVAVALKAAGMPAGFRVTSPTPGHGHFYVLQNGTELPTSFLGGEVRRGGSGMVLGPVGAAQGRGVRAERDAADPGAADSDCRGHRRAARGEAAARGHRPRPPG